MARFLTWMASLLTWMASFLMVATCWKYMGSTLFTWKNKDFLQCQMEHQNNLRTNIQSLQKTLNDINASSKMEVLNKNQCIHLFYKLIQTMKGIDKMLSIAMKNLKFNSIFQELYYLQSKVEMMGKSCVKQDQWCYEAVFQLQNKEAFRELLLDLKCCYNAAHHMFSMDHSNTSNDIKRIQFDAATFEKVCDDGRILKKRLEYCQEDFDNYKMAKHLLWRLRNLERVEGGELDDLEVSTNFHKPDFDLTSDIIGSGSCANVYKSKWLGLDSATKVLKNNSEVSVNSLKEAGILAGLNHPNLIQFFGCGVDEGADEMYLIMELMEKNLSSVLKEAKGPLPYHLAIDIMHQIAKGVYHLHDMQVAHLDLKPGNVLSSTRILKDFDPCCVFKVTDYDMSRLDVCSNPKFKRLSKYIIGTTNYRAPEMNKISGIPLYPFQADVWSFSMTCSEILSGKVPYDGLNSKDIFNQITCIDGTYGKNSRPNLPNNCEELTDLIEYCWAKDPLQRPTFSNICERLIDLKAKFLMGTYSCEMVPQFCLNKSITKSKGVNNEGTKGNEPMASQNEDVVDLKDRLLNAKGLLHMSYLGIVGMGGIGKTTLAKAIFDDIEVQSKYDASCFVDELKNQSSLEILNKILSKLESNQEATKLEDAQMIFKELLARKKVLLILDDIKDQAQMEVIVPFDVVRASKGTTIIVTTRNWSPIEAFVDEKGKLEVDILDEKESTKLFTIHLSWNDVHLSPQFLDLRRHVVHACKGLPLSLKVIGAFLHGKKSLRSWERAILRLKRAKSFEGDEKIWNTLRISFDGLDNNHEKRIFLDMACFFCRDVHSDGISKDKALNIWSENEITVMRELERLIQMSLLKLDKNGEFFEMHDQLRDMGRMIAATKFEGTRIWKASMISEYGLVEKDFEKLEGISWQGPLSHLPSILKDQTCNFNSLRLLIFQSNGCNSSENFHNLNLITSIATRSLVLKFLMIEYSKVNDKQGNLSNKDIKKQTRKDIDNSSNAKVANLCNTCTSLNVFQLRKCSFLEALPKQIASTNTMLTLDLQNCSNLTIIPKELGTIISLKTLNLSKCTSLAILPEEVGNLTSLINLDLSQCTRLTTLPKQVGNLSFLKTLNLKGCSRLTALPEEVGNLTSLTTLDLTNCSRLVALPERVENLTSLTSLYLSWCPRLVTLPEGIGNLTFLTNFYLIGCSSLMALPEGVGNLTSLTTLRLTGCSRLVALPKRMENLTSLTSLDLYGCSNLAALPKGVGNLTSLTSLDLYGCSNLAALPEGMGNLTSLTSFNLHGCLRLATLPEGMENLTSLTSLSLSWCPRLATLPEGVGNLTSLTSLSFSWCPRLAVLPKQMGNLTSLTSLSLTWCSSLVTLPEGVGNLTSLTSLYLIGCSSLAALPEGVGNLTSLTSLDLHGCSSLAALPEGVGNLTSLTSLDLHGCSSLATLPEGVGNLTSLASFDLHRCSSLAALPEGVGNLTSLISLDLHGCSSLAALPEGVGNLTSLTSFDLHGCSSLVALPEGMGNLTSLTTLNLEGNSSLVALPEQIGNLTSITSLSLTWCSSLVALPEGVGNLTSLTSLSLTWCSSFLALPKRLGNLTSLKYLNLQGCSSLVALPEEVKNMTSLISLDLGGCSSLAALPEGVEN